MNELANKNIDKIEDMIAELPQVEFKVNHYFSDGLYTRELIIPKDAVLTGHVHKRAHMNFLMKGEILINDGKDSYHLKAPAIIPSEAGARRAGIALTDCIWVTTHSCSSTNVKDAEAELVEPMRESIKVKLENNKCHLQ